jgi:predicted nucleic acid-binding protein
MKFIFADTFYFIALLSPNDQRHGRTKQLARELKARYLTTDWVMTEVADALSRGRVRHQVAPLIRRLRESPVWEIIPFSRDQFDGALEFHSRHQDKEWTLTDCASFLVMQERGITEALTGDHHFEQAGFTALLK